MCCSRRLRGSSCTLLLGSKISSSSRPLEKIDSQQVKSHTFHTVVGFTAVGGLIPSTSAVVAVRISVYVCECASGWMNYVKLKGQKKQHL